MNKILLGFLDFVLMVPFALVFFYVGAFVFLPPLTLSCAAEGLCQHDQPAASDAVQKHHQSNSALGLQRPAATQSSSPGLQQINGDQGKINRSWGVSRSALKRGPTA